MLVITRYLRLKILAITDGYGCWIKTREFLSCLQEQVWAGAGRVATSGGLLYLAEQAGSTADGGSLRAGAGVHDGAAEAVPA